MATFQKERAEALDWIARTARPLPAGGAPGPGDLLPLLETAVDGAAVAGIGAGTRGAHEHAVLQLRAAELLAARAGFRAVAFDMDWALGARLDAYVRTGTGDPRALLDEAGPIWHTAEVLALVEWARAYNAADPGDPVRLLGADVGEVRASAYDAVIDHVRTAAPGLLPELAGHYAALRPSSDIHEHIARYRSDPDRRAWIVHARAALDLVAGLPSGDEGQARAVQNARVITCFYELHDHEDRPHDPRNMAAVERGLADTLLWWHRHTGQKIVFWSASTHSANGPARAVRFPPAPAGEAQRNAGSLLREALGSSYVSIGLTFHHGELNSYAGPDPFRVRPAAPELAESVLGAAPLDGYILDLRDDHPPAWLGRPARTRVIGPRYDPSDDGAHHMSGGSLAEWFDVIVHLRRVTPTRPLH